MSIERAMIGKTISHYSILEKLGEGGMGVVYKATDTKLDRSVALKFLPSHVSDNQETKARFLLEAKAAATLNHPNICTIYGVEESGDQMFIAMEYIDAGTLHDALKTTIGNQQATIAIAIQIGEALQEAHAKGIVHRDIKADNIMLTSKGQVKVMDFGLAKLRGSLNLTRSGSTVGTLAYMSPEQIQGSGADPRSDLFSFGVLLYQMLTGKLPFQGEHEAALMYSILNEEPESIRASLPDISPSCERILEKALDKQPDERYQSAADLVADLRRWKRESSGIGRTQPPTARQPVAEPPPSSPSKVTPAGSPGRTRAIVLSALGIILVGAAGWFFFGPGGTARSDAQHMLVVLPFENQSDAAKEYFADGITEEITTRLSSLSSLGVIARSSAQVYKGSKKTVKEIGNELGVDYILMGTVRWAGQRVRVSPELINVKTGLQVWAQTFDAPFSDVFTLQSDIATKVAGAMNVRLLKPETATLSQKLTTNSEAYDFYLQGVDYMNRTNTQPDMMNAIQLFERATTLDPQFAAAFAKLSEAHGNVYWFFWDRSEERVGKSKSAAEKAVSLAPNLSASHLAMAWYYYHGRLEYENALKEFATALSLQPSNTEAYYGMAAVYRRQGRMDESIEAFRKAVAGNPRIADLVRQLGETMTLARDYSEADEAYAHALELAPDFEDTFAERAKNMILWKGDLPAARGIIQLGLQQGRIKQSEWLEWMEYTIAVMIGDFPEAEHAVNTLHGDGVDNQFSYFPRSLLRAQLWSYRGSPAMARAEYDTARVLLERRTRIHPEDERAFTALGIAYAGLGRTTDALRAGEKGVALLPVEKEAWRGTFRLADMAQIHAMLGNQDKAIDILERLVSIPSELTPSYIRLDPIWNPLRGNKRFEDLIRRQ
jgi:serine/threonine protein kinase/tetratricopeptide (TPR) repeat protein